jgi:hypothetical protein
MMDEQPKSKRGGARPGAGRPPKPRPPDPFAGIADPLEFLLAVMRSDAVPNARRVRAAIALMPFLYGKPVTTSTTPSATKPRPQVADKFAAQPTPIRPH